LVFSGVGYDFYSTLFAAPPPHRGSATSGKNVTLGTKKKAVPQDGLHSSGKLLEKAVSLGQALVDLVPVHHVPPGL
jgi:hypothetical protein